MKIIFENHRSPKKSYKCELTLSALGKPQSQTILMEKIASIFSYNALLRISNVIYMNFFTSFHHVLSILSVSHDFKTP